MASCKYTVNESVSFARKIINIAVLKFAVYELCDFAVDSVKSAVFERDIIESNVFEIKITECPVCELCILHCQSLYLALSRLESRLKRTPPV